MRIIDLIEKKKQGYVHSAEEIQFIIDSFLKESIYDYQMSAWLMAVCFKGLTINETVALTEVMANSGDKIDFGDIGTAIVDKHSTGGVGDKVTITLIPLLAAAGIPVAKLADRGLGFAAGTVDKLEAIPGFNTQLTSESIIKQVKDINAVIASQDKNLAPADKKLLALRNMTATVDNEELIASSIVSKKIASGANYIFLDVKYGAGAFMKTAEDAVNLSKYMVNLGKRLGKTITAIVTSMEEPLGRSVGNSLEVIEAIEFLKGNIKSGDLAELTFSIASIILQQLNLYNNEKEVRAYLESLINSGKALDKFKELIVTQGGNAEVITDYDKFELPISKIECESKKSGYIQNINASNVARAVETLGANRERDFGVIDYSVGIYLNKKSGEYVKRGETLYTIYSNNEEKTKIAQRFCDEAFSISDGKAAKSNLIYEIIRDEEDNDV